jgi:hypothetical protein
MSARSRKCRVGVEAGEGMGGQAQQLAQKVRQARASGRGPVSERPGASHDASSSTEEGKHLFRRKERALGGENDIFMFIF